MKFGILQFFSWPERRVALPTVYQRALQRIEIMDRTGYDAVWLTEHHFTDYSVCPSIPVLGTYTAARTQRLRIGTAVTLAAFYHPLRLAEEIALLDILSGGRVNWGAGRGYEPKEFKAFGVSFDESYARFREAVDIVVQAWTSERLTYRGKFFSFENVEVLPKPLQQPHPPMWTAAASPGSIEWAASSGYSILMDPHATHAELGEKREFYRQKLKEHGYSIAGREIPMARLLAIASTDARAAEVARQGAEWMVNTYLDLKMLGITGDPIQRYVNDVIIHGSPDRVVDEISHLREEIHLDYLMGAPLSHETFMLFTEKVLPKLL
jgi:alkanesulfonate monooxygenase SsuD/methylene tetrahydromethanopterin reductase-like flavin-dependent oxidoreductase (luciferase family)